MKIYAGLLGLGLLGSAGCGQTSYFEVTVLAGSSVPPSCLSTIDHCEVTASGAGSNGEFFTLDSRACHMPLASSIGVFQYSTDKDSGNVAFHVDLVTLNGGMLKVLASGDSAPTPVKSGGRQAVSVTTDLAAGINCP